MENNRTFEEFCDLLWSSVWTDEDRIVFREKLEGVLRPVYEKAQAYDKIYGKNI